MKLSKNQLLIKFKSLEKFKDQKWLSDEAIKADCNHKELPLQAALVMISDLIIFIEETKFSSRWEEGFSLKIRLKQIQDLLSFFCQDSDEEMTRKGANLHPTHTIPE